MCDSLYTIDGIELTTIGEARRYGIPIADRYLRADRHEDDCLCGVDLPEALSGHPSTWQEGVYWVGGRFAELDAGGQTWFDGFDVRTQHPRLNVVEISRSDGRRELTLEEWEKTNAIRKAITR